MHTLSLLALFARLNKPIPKSKPFSADHREAVSDVFRGTGVGSKTTRASSSRTNEKEEMITMLNALVTPSRLNLYSATASGDLCREVKNMLGHIRAGCIVDCFYVGSQLDEILHRAQNQAVISGNLGVALGEALLGLFLHGYNSRLFQRLYKERSINEIRFDRICPHLLRDPLSSPMDCHVMDIDLAKLKPPKGVHFGIVPNADLGGSESNALLEVAAENVTEYDEYTLARDALEGVHPANMEAIVDEDDGEIEVNLPQKHPHNTLSAEEKAEANAKKAKNKVSATEYLHSKKQCVTRLKWNDSEKALFSILAPRFPKGDSVDFPAMTLLWNNVLKADGWFEGLQYDLNPRDRVALKNHHDYRNKKQAQQVKLLPQQRCKI